MPLVSASEPAPARMPDVPDFSMVLGGPLYQLFRKAYLTGDGLELLVRRIVVITAIAWLPLLILTLADGSALGVNLKIPFLHDVETHARLLVSLPVLILAELIVHLRISPVVRRFVERGIVVGEDLPRLIAAVNSTLRARNSVVLELSLLVFVYTIGHWGWRTGIVVGVPSWYASPGDNHLNLTLPGYWFAYVSIPIFQFFLFRWYVRLFLWFRLLWKVSRLNLRLTAAHPDRAGGLGFLGRASYAFGPILFAQGVVLAGLIASRVLYDGQNLLKFKMEAAGLVAGLVLLVLGPLTMFSPAMDAAKRNGAIEYGLLANRYVFGFEEKWLRGGPSDTTELLGSGDIQSLADLGNSYSVIGEMRLVPFSLSDMLRLAGATAAPLIPLTLTIFSLEEVVTRLIQIVL
jgi:hypothetical protein